MKAAPEASATTASSGSSSVHMSGYGRVGRGLASPRAHTLTSLTRRPHIIGGMDAGTSLHRVLVLQAASGLRAGVELRGSASAARYCATAAGGRYRRRRAGAVTGATFASVRSHPVTRLTRDARKTIATQPTTRRAFGVCDDISDH